MRHIVKVKSAHFNFASSSISRLECCRLLHNVSIMIPAMANMINCEKALSTIDRQGFYEHIFLDSAGEIDASISIVRVI